MATRLPQMMMPGISMQETNDPRKFEYADPNNMNGGLFQPADQIEDPDEDGAGFQFNASPMKEGTGYYRREQQHSPNKTGGKIDLGAVAAEDISHEPFIGRDAVIVIEGEMRQFDGKRTDKVQRYVESLVTGNFMRVQKEINLQIQQADYTDKTKKLQSSRENLEREMKEIQKVWVNRVNKLFYMFLGILAGMSLMHLIVLLNQSAKVDFLQLYCKISTVINIVFMIFTSFALILGLSLTLIYKQKSDEKMRNMDMYRLEFRQHYIVSMVITIVISICLMLLYILPAFTNKLYYWNAANITDQDITITKGLFAAVNVLFLIAWLMASAFNKASIADIDLDPEDIDDTDTVDNSSVSYD